MKRKTGTLFEIYIDVRGISKYSCLRYQELDVDSLYKHIQNTLVRTYRLVCRTLFWIISSLSNATKCLQRLSVDKSTFMTALLRPCGS